MKNLKKAAAVTVMAGGLVAAVAGTASATGGGAHAGTGTMHSPGLLAGDLLQVPVDVPLNVVGDSIKVVGVMNPAFGNKGVND